jgi:hypothetical protein
MKLRSVSSIVLALLVFQALLRPVHAQSFERMGMRYKYDEKWVLSNLQRCDASLDKPPHDNPDQGSAHNNPDDPLIQTGWFIVTLGEFSTGSEKVEAALYSIMKKHGQLRVPFWVCSKRQRENILIYYSCVNPRSKSAFADPFIDDQLLFTMASNAIEDIQRRGKYKFKPYDGPVRAGL